MSVESHNGNTIAALVWAGGTVLAEVYLDPKSPMDLRKLADFIEKWDDSTVVITIEII
jgi:hypothetical protein